MRSEVRARLRGLYAITPEMADTAALLDRARQCLEGGAALLQYRVKSLADETRLAQARGLAALCRAHGVPFIVNDSIALAMACGADGVHLGRDDRTVREARSAMPEAIVGVSCYADLGRARRAGAEAADYIGIGSVFPSGTKPAATRAPLPLIAQAREASGLPVAAIGGITPANAALVRRAGADMLAVIGALFEAQDIPAAARSMARLYDPDFSGSDDARAQPRAV